MDNYNDNQNTNGTPEPQQEQHTQPVEAQQAPIQRQEAPSQQQAPQGPTEAEKKMGSIGNQLQQILKGWFSRSPLTAFRTETSWGTDAVILGITLLVQVFLGGVYLKSSLAVLGDLGSMFGGNVSGQLFGKGMGVGFVTSLFFLLLAFGMSFTLAKIFNKEASLKRVLGLTAIAMVPMTLLQLVAFIFGFFLWGFSAILYKVSVIFFFLALYLGYQVHIGRPSKSPLWVFMGLTLVVVLIVEIILGQMTGGLSSSGIGSMFGAMKNQNWGL